MMMLAVCSFSRTANGFYATPTKGTLVINFSDVIQGRRRINKKTPALFINLGQKNPATNHQVLLLPPSLFSQETRRMATEQPKAATEETKIDLFEDDDEFEEFEIDQVNQIQGQKLGDPMEP
ncbi:hypothetical protein RJ639_017158 [Escallonia herrerae]|uniref:Uncharacterized protein n=1 Tax=Escallonia herrerae TaxID=1293975 RepID=A0AA88VAU1_9ASTE|nr:hypothetical protein RJ639_017158 [Escallonia herrerae]